MGEGIGLGSFGGILVVCFGGVGVIGVVICVIC